MRRTSPLRGWRLWASIGLFCYAFFLAAFALAKTISHFGSRWDISWTAVAWGAAIPAVLVSLWTFIDSGKRR
jgi:hypothetical protein